MLDKNKIIIDDDLLTVEEQEEIKQTLQSEYFPWFLGIDKNSTVGNQWSKHFSKITSNIFEYSQFVHVFVVAGQGNSSFVDLVAKIHLRAGAKYGFDDSITRIKSNYCTKVFDQRPDAHQSPHIDCVDDHWVMIYYVNDSDGDTFIFEEKLYNHLPVESVKTLTVKDRIPPKQGRIVIFDGACLHAGMHPRTHDSRMVINFVSPK
jgi:hypothetical protein